MVGKFAILGDRLCNYCYQCNLLHPQSGYVVGFAKAVWRESHHDGEGSPGFRGAAFVVLFQDPSFEQLGPVQAPGDPLTAIDPQIGRQMISRPEMISINVTA